ARDLAAPVRLLADPAGLTVVTGFARRRRLGWSQVERVRVDVRRRSRLLEVDTGEQLYLFSRYDLDADLAEVAGALERLRATAPR
ncbi:MAG: PH domain-containing protein, partial [Natronosporangium sp.]